MTNKGMCYWKFKQNSKDEKHTHDHPIVQVADVADLNWFKNVSLIIG